MSNITNEALWGKLCEVNDKLDKQQNIPNVVPISKEEVEQIVEKYTSGHTLKVSSYFEAIQKHMQIVNSNIQKVQSAMQNIKISDSPDLDNIKTLLEKKDVFNFALFKVRKSSFVIAVLGILVFILTLFSMKQQNDYSLLTSRYYRQAIVINHLKLEVDSLKAIPILVKKKRYRFSHARF